MSEVSTISLDIAKNVFLAQGALERLNAKPFRNRFGRRA